MMPMPENKGRDKVFRYLFILVIGGIFGLFLVIFITPFVVHYPYDLTFTMAYAKKAILSNNVLSVYKNSLFVAVMTALIGSLVAYSAAIIRSRSNAYKSQKVSLDALATITNSVPGMVLGLAYLFMFKDLSLKGTYWILILCNVVHFFTTPYLMAKNALSKMNTNYEIIGQLMGDKWHETIIRVIIPNSIETLVQMLSYFLIHSMITVSALIFLVTARTSVMTSKIKELQHYGNFNEIFILSILIFVTNLVVKITFNYINNRLSFRS
jgi:iron(III) transport system permease protein